MYTVTSLSMHMHTRVELPDWNYTLVPEEVDEGADEELLYVGVEQDPDQSPEGPKASFADEGKPRSINLLSFNFCTALCFDCAFTFRS